MRKEMTDGGAGGFRAWLLPLLPAAAFLAVLPVTHTAALRLSLLILALGFAIRSMRRQPAPWQFPAAPMAAWAGIAAASVLWSVDGEYSTGEVMNEVVFAMTAFFTFLILTRGQREMRLFFGVIAGSVAAISAYAIGYYAIRRNWPGTAGFSVGDVNAYSTYIVLTTPVMVYGLCEKNLPPLRRGLAAAALLLGLLGGALTLNRTMWIAISAGVLVFALMQYGAALVSPGRQRRMGTLVAVLVAISAAQFTAANYLKSHGKADSVPSGIAFITGDARGPIWDYALERAQDRPLTGYGFGRGILRGTFRKDMGFGAGWHGHNVFLNYAIAVGVPGLLAYVWLLLALGVSFRRIAAQPHSKSLGALGAAVLAAMVTRSLTDDAVVRETSLLFWSLAGMIMGSAVGDQKEADESGRNGADAVKT